MRPAKAIKTGMGPKHSEPQSKKLSEEYLACFVKGYFLHKISKQNALRPDSPGLEPQFFSPLLDRNAFLKKYKIEGITKNHPFLFDELHFFVGRVTQEETPIDSSPDPELFGHFFAYLGGMYFSLDASRHLMPVPSSNRGPTFEQYCLNKLAACFFYEQELFCWHGISLFSEGRSGSRSHQPDVALQSPDDLRSDHQGLFDPFLGLLSSYLIGKNLFECLDLALCSRSFYWDFLFDLASKLSIKNPGLFGMPNKKFPSVIIRYRGIADPRIISTEPPDPIFRLNRTVYRPNSPKLLADCSSVLNKSADLDTKQLISDWLRPFFKFAFQEMGLLGFIPSTREHHRLMVELQPYLLQYVVNHSEGDRPPRPKQLHEGLMEFMKEKKAAIDSVPILEKDGTIKKVPVERYHHFENSKATRYIEEHIMEIKQQAASLLWGKPQRPRDAMIVSIEHPDTKRISASTIVPLIQIIIGQNIDVDICHGVFRYSEGQHKGGVIEEISLACYVDTPAQRQFIVDLGNRYHQESYLLVGMDDEVYLTNFTNGKRQRLGKWGQVGKLNDADLSPGDGYTIINDTYFQAKTVPPGPIFICSNQYRNIKTSYGEFFLTDRQARVIKHMHEQLKKGITEMKGSDILSTLNIEDQIQRVFEHQLARKWVPNDAWGKLIVSSKRGYFKLKI